MIAPRQNGVQRSSLPRRMTMRALGLLACLMAAGPALAQQAGGQIQIPLVDLPAPGDARVEMPATQETEMLQHRLSHAERRGSRPAQAPQPRATRQLISPLNPDTLTARRIGSRLRVEGERQVLDFTLYLSDPARLRQMRLATVSSINVLPERSRFRLLLNGTELGTGRLEHFAEVAARDLEVEPGLARAGVNHVRIEIDHHHRIFCGPEAAFGMWTDIDLSGSGGVLDGEGVMPSAEAFLIGLAADAASGAGYEIRNADILGAQRDAILGRITQRIAQSLGNDAVPFRTTGVWTLAGQDPVAARVTFLHGPAPGVRFTMGGDGAQVMVITLPPGATPADLPAFDHHLPRLPGRQQLAVLDTTHPVALGDLGFRSLELHGRYALEHAHFRLPEDYVVMTNLKAYLRLSYIFAENLPDDAMLQVHVNGTNIRLLPLWTGGGRLIEDFPIRFEARHLRAGVNTIGFEMIIPGDPDDLPCPPRTGPVLAISQATTISVPYSPSMYLADMHHAFNALSPASVRPGDLSSRLYSGRDVLMIRAALRNPHNAPTIAPDPTLLLIPPEDLGAVPTGGYRINRSMLDAVLIPPVDTEALLAGPSRPGGEPELLSTRPEHRGAGTAALTSGWSWLVERSRDAMQWMHPRAGDYLEAWLTDQRGQAIFLQLDPAMSGTIWMVRAPDSDMDAIVASMAAARASGDGPRGQVSVLDHDGRWQNWYAPNRQPVMLEPLSLTNLRPAIGNFVSAMPIRFVALLFLLALISAAIALRLVIATRET